MSCFCELKHHILSSFVPNSIRLVRISSIQVTRMTSDREEICEHSWQLRENYFRFSAFSFSPHTMSLNIDMKMVLPSNCSGSHCRIFHKCLNLFEEVKSRESWEYFPLELHRLSINTIQIFQMITLEIPLNFSFQASFGFSFLPPKQSTESAKT